MTTPTTSLREQIAEIARGVARAVDDADLLFSGCGCHGDHCGCSEARELLVTVLINTAPFAELAAIRALLPEGRCVHLFEGGTCNLSREDSVHGKRPSACGNECVELPCIHHTYEPEPLPDAVKRLVAERSAPAAPTQDEFHEAHRRARETFKPFNFTEPRVGDVEVQSAAFIEEIRQHLVKILQARGKE